MTKPSRFTFSARLSASDPAAIEPLDRGTQPGRAFARTRSFITPILWPRQPTEQGEESLTRTTVEHTPPLCAPALLDGGLLQQLWIAGQLKKNSRKFLIFPDGEDGGQAL